MRYKGTVAIRYWLGVVQRGDVLRGVELGIAQLNHGAKTPLMRMNEADGFVYYSPKTSYPDGEPLREFTAIGRVADSDVFQVSAAPLHGPAGDFRPWRRRIDYETDAVPAPIRPLLPVLDFTREKADWGFQLRRGLIEISRHDFDVIRAQMRRPPADEPGAGRVTMTR